MLSHRFSLFPQEVLFDKAVLSIPNLPLVLT